MAKISIKNIAEAIEAETQGKTGAELSTALKNSVKFLHKKGMLSQSGQVLEMLEKNINKKNGIVKMRVRSAKEVPEAKRKELEAKLKEKYKAKEIVSEYFEDKYLLGGMKIEVGEEVMDLTYRNKLDQLEKHLIQR